MADLDPPFYNTLDNYRSKVPGVDSQSKGGDRSKRLRGSTTDPANPDTDYDGIPDGIEDRDRNGWVNGDGASIAPTWDPVVRPRLAHGRVGQPMDRKPTRTSRTPTATASATATARTRTSTAGSTATATPTASGTPASCGRRPIRWIPTPTATACPTAGNPATASIRSIPA